MKINLVSCNGYYISPEWGGTDNIGDVHANRNQPLSQEVLILHELGDDLCVIETNRGRFFSVQPNGGLVANRARISDSSAPDSLRTVPDDIQSIARDSWEVFVIEDAEKTGFKSFLSVFGTYISANLNYRDVPLSCDKKEKHEWESFFIKRLSEKLSARGLNGNFCGIYIPELINYDGVQITGDNGVLAQGIKNGLLFTDAYPVYDDPAIRKIIRNVYQTRGYTDFPISLWNASTRWYHNIYPPDRVDIQVCLDELKSDGLSVVGFACDDNELTPSHSVSEALVDLVVPGWERDEHVDLLCENTYKAYPNTEMALHFTPDHGAPWTPESDAWRTVVNRYGVTRLLYQTNLWQKSLQDAIDRIDDYLIRFGSNYHGWPSVKFELFETMAYSCFWDGTLEVDCNNFNAKVLAIRTKIAPTLIENGTRYIGSLINGFCNGH